MADDEPITKPGRDLLAAYKVHTGPSQAAIERIAAALRDETPPVIVLHRRWRWAVGTVLLAAALGLLALRSSLVQRHAAQVDAAAKYERTPDGMVPVQVREVAVDPGMRVAPPEVAHEQAPVRPRRDAQPAVQAPQGPSLAEEMQAMRAAQAALAAGATAEALALLDAYARQFPEGRLREESLALRAIALCSGEPPAGQAEADAFLAQRPRSVFVSRVRKACGI